MSDPQVAWLYGEPDGYPRLEDDDEATPAIVMTRDYRAELRKLVVGWGAASGLSDDMRAGDAMAAAIEKMLEVTDG